MGKNPLPLPDSPLCNRGNGWEGRRRLAPIEVFCPLCKALPGERCTKEWMRGGNGLAEVPHIVRIVARNNAEESLHAMLGEP